MFFGPRKDKASLDWEPDLDEASAQSGAVAASSLRKSAQSASRPLSAPSRAVPGHQEPASDLWTGLIHPRAIIRFISSNFFSIAKTTIIFALLGFAVYFILPENYRTSALILVDPRQPRVTNSETVLTGIGGDTAALSSYVEIINSDGFLGKVVDEMGVKDDPDYEAAEDRTELISMFRENVAAMRQGATYLVEVTSNSKDPQVAAAYANGVAEAFVRDQKDFRTTTSEETARWLSERLTELRSNLQQSEGAVAAYRARNGIVESQQQGSLDEQQLSSLVTQLAQANTDLAEAQARYQQAKADGVPASSQTGQVDQFGNLNILMREQATLRRQAAELGQTLGNRHPQILANQQQQKITENQISAERRRLVQRSKQAFETARAKQASLEGQLADARQRTIRLNKAKVELANLEREANANRNLYEQFLARYKITDEQSQFQFNEARIVSAAPVPFESTKPSVVLVGVALIIIGGGFGVLMALLKLAFAMPQPASMPARSVSHAPLGNEQDERQVNGGINLDGAAEDDHEAERQEDDAFGGDVPRRALSEHDPVLLTLPARTGVVKKDEAALEELLQHYRETLVLFVTDYGEQRAISILVTAPQSAGGQQQTSDLLREFSIDEGFHPVVISLDDATRTASLAVQSDAHGQAVQATRIQQYEEFDAISFTAAFQTGSNKRLTDTFFTQLADLVALCKENYGFVILETHKILDADMLAILVELTDASLVALDADALENEDLEDWRDWALESDARLVLEQTRS